MKISFITLPVFGHLNPMIALARKVQSLGHDVSLISAVDAEPFARTANLRFIPVGENEFPIGSHVYVEKLHSELTAGEEGLRTVFSLLGHVAGSLLRPLEQALVKEGSEAVVLDTYQKYMELVPIHLGLPYIHVSNALHFDVSGETPLCFFDWPHSTDPEAKKRNLEGVEVFRSLLEPSLEAAKKYAEEVGLSVDWKDLSTTTSKLAWITQIPKDLDFSGPEPSPYTNTGSFQDDSARPEVAFPWEELSDAPLVYASMGTLQTGLRHVFEIIRNVAADHSQYQFVIAIGGVLDPAQFDPLPSNVILVRRAPQLELLKRAHLCITHAGLNTVLEALSQGVPLVAIPVTNDQPGVAARLVAKKVGLATSLEELTQPRLSELVTEVLENPLYRKNAQKMQAAIFSRDGLSLAANLIDKAFSQAQKSQ
ncbi:nucleotide disphospho-sugar-binding domain-containing protein [Terriglobus saanensis]|uniref:Glycosyltransferase, MGT family n=1 Tax=Terriglobus saanensis (strain ATCC BAA-1853 / DSM 23119 / SP1PR4) TaxID=401053 RepID=E8V5Z6_TERSS|nr:nucleotide disphospho-sugar-binding domain-containing protein [Terriglobus saanensis]ADV83814.1 glycosyltransferase, MGT family [Terriglobus saanensis SP1PR4]